MTLLDEAIGSVSGGFVLIEDCVETSAGFVLHHLIKRALDEDNGDGCLILLAFANPFSHYDRILRKLGCNLSAHREKMKLHFFDLMKMDFQVRSQDNEVEEGKNNLQTGLIQLFGKIHGAVELSFSVQNRKHFTIMIDDLSLLEIATHGSTNDVLDFLHYCSTINSNVECSIIVLNHMDIYSTTKVSQLLSQLEFLANVILKSESLSTGLAADVHGQLTVINKGTQSRKGGEYSRSMVRSFHFKVKENAINFFYPDLDTKKAHVVAGC